MDEKNKYWCPSEPLRNIFEFIHPAKYIYCDENGTRG